MKKYLRANKDFELNKTQYEMLKNLAFSLINVSEEINIDKDFDNFVRNNLKNCWNSSMQDAGNKILEEITKHFYD